MTDDDSAGRGSSERYDSAQRSIEENRTAVERTQTGVRKHLDGMAVQLGQDRDAINTSLERLARAAQRRRKPEPPDDQMD